jgi:hypothetical protein
MDGPHFDDERFQRRPITTDFVTPNTWRTYEADAAMLQRDVDWINGNYGSLNVTPKFTKGGCRSIPTTRSAISTTRSTQ